MFQNAEHCSIRAVRRSAIQTRWTPPATAVDLADDASAAEWTRLGDTHEFVSEDAGESHVAFDQLKVRLAHASAYDAHENLAVTCNRYRMTRLVRNPIAFENDRAHRH
jgi:hypothetical protein